MIAGLQNHTMDLTNPPSTRSDDPLVAEASGLATYVTILAISSTEAKRFNNDDGRAVSKNSFSICSVVMPRLLARSSTNVPTPSERVGPGSTEFTVTLVPLVSSANPPLLARRAVLLPP